MEYEEIGGLDCIQFYGGMGNLTPTVYVKLKLSETIDRDCLVEALEKTTDIFRAFKMTLGIRDNALVYVNNDRELPVFPYSGKARSFCTEMTNGYAYCIYYKDNEIHLSMHHGMTDGEGAASFLRILLCNYFNTDTDTDLIDSTEPDIELPKEDMVSDDPEPGTVFSTSGFVENSLSGDVRHRVFYLKEDEFMETVRSKKGSAVPFLSMCLARAVRRAYPVDDKIIRLTIPVSLRTRMGINACRNLAPAVHINYDRELDELPEEECLLRIRQELKSQTQLTHLLGIIKKQNGVKALLEDPKESPYEKCSKLIRHLAVRMAETQSALITYFRPSFPETVSGMIKSVEFTANFRPNFVLAHSMPDGRIRFDISLGRGDQKLYNAFTEILKEYGIAVEEGEPVNVSFDELSLADPVMISDMRD